MDQCKFHLALSRGFILFDTIWYSIETLLPNIIESRQKLDLLLKNHKKKKDNLVWVDDVMRAQGHGECK